MNQKTILPQRMGRCREQSAAHAAGRVATRKAITNILRSFAANFRDPALRPAYSHATLAALEKALPHWLQPSRYCR